MNKPQAQKVDLYQWYDMARYIDNKYEVESDDFRVFLMEQYNLTNGGIVWIDFYSYCDYVEDSEENSQFHKFAVFYAEEFSSGYICFSW